MPDIDREKLLKSPVGPVRISMPAKVAYNRDLFNDTLVNILEELGCRACFSGADCTFQLEREFVVNPRLQLSPRLTQTRISEAGTDVSVNISQARAAFSIDSVNDILDKVLDELGCLACCSGFDITFRTELERIQPRQFNV